MRIKFLEDCKNLVKEGARDFKKNAVTSIPDDIAKLYINDGLAVDINGKYKKKKEKKDKE